MTYFEKDFILRQTKDMSAALAKFMDKEAVDDLFKLEAQQAEPSDKGNNKRVRDDFQE